MQALCQIKSIREFDSNDLKIKGFLIVKGCLSLYEIVLFWEFFLHVSDNLSKWEQLTFVKINHNASIQIGRYLWSPLPKIEVSYELF